MGKRYILLEVPVKNGLADGQALSYHPEGKLFVTQQFKKGYKDGPGKQFDFKGLPWAEFNYTNGKLNGELKLYTNDSEGLPKGITIFKDGEILSKTMTVKKVNEKNLGTLVKFSKNFRPIYCGWIKFTEDHAYADAVTLDNHNGKLELLRATGEGEIHKTAFSEAIPVGQTEASLAIVGAPYGPESVPTHDGSIQVRVYEVQRNKTFRLTASGSAIKKPVLFKAISANIDSESFESIYTLDYRKDIPFTNGLKDIDLECNLKKIKDQSPKN
ncbi:MAG: hypothetical protein Q7U04_06895 [Bacteriovorax sp.]|nr:hypothetical protein [Bacteriovorax sp.]